MTDVLTAFLTQHWYWSPILVGALTMLTVGRTDRRVNWFFYRLLPVSYLILAPVFMVLGADNFLPILPGYEQFMTGIIILIHAVVLLLWSRPSGTALFRSTYYLILGMILIGAFGMIAPYWNGGMPA